jgi:hypothetical protein
VSTTSELARISRDLASLEEEVATALAPRSKSPLTEGERRSVRSALQGLIQRLDELNTRLAG